MIRPATLVMLGLAFGMIAILFHVSYLVSELADDLTRVTHEITSDQDEIHVLRAEWSFLNGADRLQSLSGRHLDLAPFDPAQIVAVAAIPFKPGEAPAVAGVAVSLSLAARPKAKPRPPRAARRAVPPAAVAPAGAAVTELASTRTLADLLAELVPPGRPGGGDR